MTDTQSDDTGAPSTFIHSLWSILGDAANANIIAWLSDDASFRIIDVAQLEARVLPQYFAHSNVASFTRQLSAYGFVSARVKPSARTANTAYTFRHNNNLFCRTQPLLSARIMRQHPRRPTTVAGREKESRKRPHSTISDVSSSGGASETAPDDETRLLLLQLEGQRARIAKLTAQIAQLTEQLSEQ